EKAEAAAGREHAGNAGDGALEVVHVLQHVDGEHEVEGPFEAGAAQVLGRAAAVVDCTTRAPGVLPRRRERLLRRVDAGHRRPLGSERLGEDAAATPDIEDALPPEPAEHTPEVFDP